MTQDVAYSANRRGVGAGPREVMYIGTDREKAMDFMPASLKEHVENNKYHVYWFEKWENGKRKEFLTQCDLIGHDMYMDDDDPDKSSCNYCGAPPE